MNEIEELEQLKKDKWEIQVEMSNIRLRQSEIEDDLWSEWIPPEEKRISPEKKIKLEKELEGLDTLLEECKNKLAKIDNRLEEKEKGKKEKKIYRTYLLALSASMIELDLWAYYRQQWTLYLFSLIILLWLICGNYAWSYTHYEKNKKIKRWNE